MQRIKKYAISNFLDDCHFKKGDGWKVKKSKKSKK